MKGGIDSFSLRSTTATKLKFEHKTCSHDTYADLVFDSVDEVLSHYSGKTQGAGIIATLEAEDAHENLTDDDLFTEDVSEEDAAAASENSSPKVEALAQNVAGVVEAAVEASTPEEQEKWLESLQSMMMADTTGRVAHEIGRLVLGPGESIYGDGPELELLQGDDQADLRRAVMKILLDRTDGASQNAILRIMQHPFTSEDDRRLMLTGLLAIDKPTKAMVSYVNDLATSSTDPDTDAAAVSVLSAFAGRLPASHQIHLNARAHITGLLAQTAAADNEHGQVIALVALGNLGSDKDVHAIGEYLKSASPVLREQAATSLRRIKSPEATELLTQHFLVEPVEMARLATLTALQHRDLPASVWKDLAVRLQAGGSHFPPLTKNVADSLLTVLRGHGMDATFLPAAAPVDGAGLDVEEMLQEDEVPPVERFHGDSLEQLVEEDNQIIGKVKKGVGLVKEGLKHVKTAKGIVKDVKTLAKGGQVKR